MDLIIRVLLVATVLFIVIDHFKLIKWEFKGLPIFAILGGICAFIATWLEGYWWIYPAAVVVIALIIIFSEAEFEFSINGKPFGVPEYKNPPPPPPKKIGIKEVYEYLETRALDLENINDTAESQAFPLWINIDDVYHILSMCEHGDFEEFFRKQGLCYDHGFSCDADDFDLPEFPAKKNHKS